MTVGGKQFHCEMSCDYELANELVRCSGKNASYITKAVTSRFHGNQIFSSKQTHVKQNGGADNCFSAFFLRNDDKSISQGENHVKSNHMESFSASQGVLKGRIHANMKKKAYNVTVSEMR